MSGTRFRYSLEALLRKQRSDWKAAKMEEAGAMRVVDDRRTEARQAQDEVEEAERWLRRARRTGARVDAAREQLMARYLLHQRAVLEQRELALRRAIGVCERVRSNLEKVSRGVKSLERHRAERETDHQSEQGRLEQKRLDELWLIGQREQSE